VQHSVSRGYSKMCFLLEAKVSIPKAHCVMNIEDGAEPREYGDPFWLLNAPLPELMEYP
jgi:hypothetical protein